MPLERPRSWTGSDAGANQTTGSNNIYIANGGVAAESGQIRIGNTTAHTQATIAGIHGNTSSGGTTVFVNASGTLGTTTSSARFKRDVKDMGVASELLMALRPVTFRYREEVVEDAEVRQYGLIAEEVEAVAPGLVSYDGEGQPYSVRYDVLPSLLLNEMQKQQRVSEEQHRRDEEQAGVIEQQAGLIDEQRQVIAALADRLGQVERLLAAGPLGVN